MLKKCIFKSVSPPPPTAQSTPIVGSLALCVFYFWQFRPIRLKAFPQRHANYSPHPPSASAIPIVLPPFSPHNLSHLRSPFCLKSSMPLKLLPPVIPSPSRTPYYSAACHPHTQIPLLNLTLHCLMVPRLRLPMVRVLHSLTASFWCL